MDSKAKRSAQWAKNTICLWYDKDAEAAARFYAETFPDSTVGAIHEHERLSIRQEGRCSGGRIHRCRCRGIGLNGGPVFKHNEAFSFQIATDDQQETTAIGMPSSQWRPESQCGCAKTNGHLLANHAALADGGAGGRRRRSRVVRSNDGMRKIDLAAIKAARHG